jgi:hypothetical protein
MNEKGNLQSNQITRKCETGKQFEENLLEDILHLSMIMDEKFTLKIGLGN